MPFLQYFSFLLVSAQIIHRTCKIPGEIAFTFDEGPSMYTGTLLNVLTRLNAFGAFHIDTDFLSNPVNAAFLYRMAADGHLIGLFLRYNGETLDQLMETIRERSDIVSNITDREITFLRFQLPHPPVPVLRALSNQGYQITTFNLDSQDYLHTNATENDISIFEVYKNTFDLINSGAIGSFISVQRDSIRSSVYQSRRIFDYTLQKGYRIVRLDSCIGFPVNDSPINRLESASGLLEMEIQFWILILFIILLQ